jgi:hypothetical protein
VAFFHSVPGLAFLHRLVVAIHLVCTEVGACGMRLVGLLLKRTGLDRFVGASYGAQHQVNRQVEEAIVAYGHEESARLAHEMPAQEITMTQDETCTGGLCLVGIEPKSNSIVLEHPAAARDQATWQQLMAKPRHDLLYASASFHRLDCRPSKPALSTGHQWLKMLSCPTPWSVLG